MRWKIVSKVGVNDFLTCARVPGTCESYIYLYLMLQTALLANRHIHDGLHPLRPILDPGGFGIECAVLSLFVPMAETESGIGQDRRCQDREKRHVDHLKRLYQSDCCCRYVSILPNATSKAARRVQVRAYRSQSLQTVSTWT